MLVREDSKLSLKKYREVQSDAFERLNGLRCSQRVFDVCVSLPTRLKLVFDVAASPPTSSSPARPGNCGGWCALAANRSASVSDRSLFRSVFFKMASRARRGAVASFRRVRHRGADLAAAGRLRHLRLLHQHLQFRPRSGEWMPITPPAGRPADRPLTNPVSRDSKTQITLI